MRTNKLFALAIGLFTATACGGIDTHTSLEEGLAAPTGQSSSPATAGGLSTTPANTGSNTGNTSGPSTSTTGGTSTTGTAYPGATITFSYTSGGWTSCVGAANSQALLDMWGSDPWTLDIGGDVDPTVAADMSAAGFPLTPVDQYWGRTLSSTLIGGAVPMFASGYEVTGNTMDPNLPLTRTVAVSSGLGTGVHIFSSPYIYVATAADTLNGFAATGMLFSADFGASPSGTVTTYRVPDGTEYEGALWVDFVNDAWDGTWTDTANYCSISYTITGTTITPN